MLNKLASTRFIDRLIFNLADIISNLENELFSESNFETNNDPQSLSLYHYESLISWIKYFFGFIDDEKYNNLDLELTDSWLIRPDIILDYFITYPQQW